MGCTLLPRAGHKSVKSEDTCSEFRGSLTRSQFLNEVGENTAFLIIILKMGRTFKLTEDGKRKWRVQKKRRCRGCGVVRQKNFADHRARCRKFSGWDQQQGPDTWLPMEGECQSH